MENLVEFAGWKCKVIKTEYLNGQTGLRLVDDQDELPVATATVAVADIPVNNDQVIIKDYSENKGVFDALAAAGVISSDYYSVKHNHVTFKIARCLI